MSAATDMDEHGLPKKHWNYNNNRYRSQQLFRGGRNSRGIVARTEYLRLILGDTHYQKLPQRDAWTFRSFRGVKQQAARISQYLPILRDVQERSSVQKDTEASSSVSTRRKMKSRLPSCQPHLQACKKFGDQTLK